MEFTNDKYFAALKNAKAHLIACKSCSVCGNSVDKINRDTLSVTTYCSKYRKDVTRKTGFMCNEFCSRKGE